ncbi:MAG: hypothetical protein WKF37_06730, partial [Bryobacteraceae bacterium]
PAIGRATINLNECVECYACYNGLSQEHLNPTVVRSMRKVFKAMRLRFDPEPDVCPTAAFEPDELQWPRVVRRAFSDPRVPHESTGIEGRGTEEVKTNDVTGRVKVGEVGFTIEFGRPGVGAWFRDIQKMCWALAKANVAFEKKNPITSLMSDVASGTLREDIMGEKVMSAIVEIKVTVERTEEIVRLVWEVENKSTPWLQSESARVATRTATIMSWRPYSRSLVTNWSGQKPTQGLVEPPWFWVPLPNSSP